jgi:hypothetical protein
LGKAPDTALWDGKTAHEISALPAQRKTKTHRRVFWVCFANAHPTLPLVENKTQKISVWEKYRKVWRGEKRKLSAFDVCYWQKSLAWWWGKESWGEVVRGFCIWSLGLAEERVFGMEVFLCWFGLGIATVWDIWLGVGDGELSVFDWKLVRELENFGFFPSFGGTDMAWFYTQGKDIREFSSGIWAVFVSWTFFGGTFGKTGGWKGIW